MEAKISGRNAGPLTLGGGTESRVRSESRRQFDLHCFRKAEFMENLAKLGGQ